jgi:hypothetical protein
MRRWLSRDMLKCWGAVARPLSDRADAILAYCSGASAVVGEMADVAVVPLPVDGALLADHALRLVVPGDRRGGRSVRDVVRIDID